MKPTETTGVYKKNDRIFTENPVSCTGIKVYNEQLYTDDGKEYRSWNPFRSKLAAALLKGISVPLKPDAHLLYLGAATGTTVSHLADILTNGTIYAVENSPIAMSSLLKVSDQRPNIIPVLEDANHPERYNSFVPPVDLLYQDISQRNQAEIFFRNATRYLKKNGTGILMVKARSIDVSLKPRQAYDLVCSQLATYHLHVHGIKELGPYEKDHAIITISLS